MPTVTTTIDLTGSDHGFVITPDGTGHWEAGRGLYIDVPGANTFATQGGGLTLADFGLPAGSFLHFVNFEVTFERMPDPESVPWRIEIGGQSTNVLLLPPVSEESSGEVQTVTNRICVPTTVVSTDPSNLTVAFAAFGGFSQEYIRQIVVTLEYDELDYDACAAPPDPHSSNCFRAVVSDACDAALLEGASVTITPVASSTAVDGDSFTGDAGTPLNAHYSDGGNPWRRVDLFGDVEDDVTNPDLALDGSGALGRAPFNTDGGWWPEYVLLFAEPSTADYTVEATLNLPAGLETTQTLRAYLLLRASTDGNLYRAAFEFTGAGGGLVSAGIALYHASGTGAVLLGGTDAPALLTPGTHRLQVSASGSTLSARITTAGADTIMASGTDGSPITDVGLPGLGWWAEDTAGDGPATPPTLDDFLVIETPSAGDPASGLTDSFGELDLCGFAEGDVTVEVSLDGYTSVVTGATVVPDTTTRVDVQLTPVGGCGGPAPTCFLITVKDACDEHLLQSASVTISPTAGGAPQSGLTNASGEIEFCGVNAAGYLIQLSRDGYNATSTGATAVSGETTPVEVHMVPIGGCPSSLLITVHEACGGTPLEGVTLSGGFGVRVTDVNGEAGGMVSSGTYLVSGGLSGYTPATGSVVVPPSGSASIDLVMTPTSGCPSTVTVSVTESCSGTALSGVTLSGIGSGGVTNGAGQATISGVASGTYSVSGAHLGYATATGSVSVPSGGSAALSLALTPTGGCPGSVVVTVVESCSGTPLSGVTLSGPASGTTDASGHATLAGITPGVQTVTATKTGYTSVASGVTIPAGAATTLVISMTPTGGCPVEPPVEEQPKVIVHRPPGEIHRVNPQPPRHLRYLPQWLSVYGTADSPTSGSLLYQLFSPQLAEWKRFRQSAEELLDQATLLEVPFGIARLGWYLHARLSERDAFTAVVRLGGADSLMTGTIRRAGSGYDFLTAYDPVYLIDPQGTLAFRNLNSRTRLLSPTDGTYVFTGEPDGLVRDAPVTFWYDGEWWLIPPDYSGLDTVQGTVTLPEEFTGAITFRYLSRRYEDRVEVSLDDEPYQTPQKLDLWNRFDELGLLAGLYRRPGESNLAFRERIYGRFLSEIGTSPRVVAQYIATDLGLIDVLTWDGQTPLNLPSSGYTQVQQVQVRGVSEIETYSEELLPTGAEGEFTASKAGWLPGSLIHLEGRIVSRLTYPDLLVSGKVVAFGAPVSQRAFASYRFRNYTLSRSASGTVDTLAPVTENLVPGEYEVLLLREIQLHTIDTEAFHLSELLDAAGRPNGYFRQLRETLLTGSSVHLGRSGWMQGYWLLDQDDQPPVSYLPIVFDQVTE